MDGWDSWNTPIRDAERRNADRGAISEALTAARMASLNAPKAKYRKLVWDRGMPFETSELITIDHPKWFEADIIRDY